MQLLRADRDNRKAPGQGFFNIIEETISTVEEDIAQDRYELVASHREKNNSAHAKNDAHDIDTSAKLDNYERNRRKQTVELGAPTSSQLPPELDNADKEEDTANETDTNQGQEEEPSLFDTLQVDAEDDDNDDDLNPKEQEKDNTVGSTRQGLGPRVCQVLVGQDECRTSVEAMESTMIGERQSWSRSPSIMAIKKY